MFTGTEIGDSGETFTAKFYKEGNLAATFNGQLNADGSVPIGKTKLTSGEYSVEISSGSRTLLPFKAVIKPKTSKNSEDIDQSISSTDQKIDQEDDTEYVSLNETQNDKLKTNQYQQIGQDNNLSTNQVSKIGPDKLSTQEPGITQELNKNNQDSDVYKTLEQNSNLSDLTTTANPNNLQNVDGSLVTNVNPNNLQNVDGSLVTNVNPDNLQNTDGSLLGDSKQETIFTDVSQSNNIEYRTLQPGQISENYNQSQDETESIFDTPAEQIKGKISEPEFTPIKTDTKGETFVPENVSQGVTGETQVSLTESFGVTGQTEVVTTQNFGATGEKIVLDSSVGGAKGETSTAINNEQPNASTYSDQKIDENNNFYKQVGPDGQNINEEIADAGLNQDLVANGEKLEIESGGNRLTFEKMSNTDSSQISENRVSQGAEGNTNDDKSIYASLPQQEFSAQENFNNTDITNNQSTESVNLSSNQVTGAKGESASSVTNIEGAIGDKTVNVTEGFAAKGETSVTYRELPGSKGETGVTFADTTGVSGTTGTGEKSSNQQGSTQGTPSNDGNTNKLIINRPGSGDNQTQNVNNLTGQATGTYNELNTNTSSVDGNKATPYRNINISNVSQNALSYEDIQSQNARGPLSNQQANEQYTNQEQLSQSRPVYKTITDDSGNTYQIDEYGNKINESDFSYEDLQSESNISENSTRGPRYSTIDGIREIDRPEQQNQNGIYASGVNQNSPQDGLNLNESGDRVDVTSSNGQYDISNLGNRSSGRAVNNQAQSVYTPLPNASRLSKSDNSPSNQSDTKNYNFIQKLSMTINKALGIEPQSVKDELKLTSEAEQDFLQNDGTKRVVSPRVTGLVESKDFEDDEEEDRKNKRKRFRYQRVGYTEPDFKAPEPVKLDDETQAFKDLYGERNRFDFSGSETNSALLRRAEEEIEKQSEAVKEANTQEASSQQSENNQDIESVYYIELMKERARLEQALEDERESNRLAIRKSEDNIQQQLLDLILNAQNTDVDSRSNDPISQLVQTLISEDKNKNSEQVVIDATKIVQMIQNQITESNGSPIDEFLLRKRIEDELKSEFVYMQREQEKKMKLVYRKMLEDMYMDMINS